MPLRGLRCRFEKKFSYCFPLLARSGSVLMKAVCRRIEDFQIRGSISAFGAPELVPTVCRTAEKFLSSSELDACAFDALDIINENLI